MYILEILFKFSKPNLKQLNDSNYLRNEVLLDELGKRRVYIPYECKFNLCFNVYKKKSILYHPALHCKSRILFDK